MALILFVDDDGMTLQLMGQVSRLLMQSAILSSSPALALAIAAEKQPDFIIIDMRMQEMDGLDFLRKLRQQPETLSIPAVVISADNSPFVVENAIKAGANEFYPKPLRIVQLETLIEKYERHREST